MTTYTFRVEENDEYGFTGLILEEAPSSYYPLTGMGIAHDILEHFPKDEGTEEDELLALGAALYIRGNGNYWNQRIGPEEQLAPDFVTLYRTNPRLLSPGRTTKLGAYVEEWITKNLERFEKELLSDWEDVDASGVESWVSAARGWLRRGYRRAARRYKATDPYTLVSMFRYIEERANAFLKNNDGFSRFHIQVSGTKVVTGETMFDVDEDGYEKEWIDWRPTQTF